MAGTSNAWYIVWGNKHKAGSHHTLWCQLSYESLKDHKGTDTASYGPRAPFPSFDRRYSKCFTNIRSFNPYYNPMNNHPRRCGYYPHFTGGKRGTERVTTPGYHLLSHAAGIRIHALTTRHSAQPWRESLPWRDTWLTNPLLHSGTWVFQKTQNLITVFYQPNNLPCRLTPGYEPRFAGSDSLSTFHPSSHPNLKPKHRGCFLLLSHPGPHLHAISMPCQLQFQSIFPI